MKRKLYAAYGSNMNIEQMRYRCPDAVIVQNAEIDGYELVFRGVRRGGVATIEPKEGCSVPVVVWAISDRDEKNLDLYEGYPNLYIKKTFEIEGSKVMVYVMSKGYPYCMPSQSYFQTILEGYDGNGINRRPLNEGVLQTYDYIKARLLKGNKDTDGYSLKSSKTANKY